MQSNEISLCELFESFQGEYPDIGGIYTFIRFSDCNMKCPWCHLEDGTTVYRTQNNFITSVHKYNESDLYLETIDENSLQVKYAKVLARNKFIFDAVVKITLLTGQTFIVSYDHMFLTQIGWTNAVNLNEGDLIFSKSGSFIRISNKEILTGEYELTSIKTDTNTYLYGNVLHHNCDTVTQMKNKKITVPLQKILASIKNTKGILFTGGEPGLYTNEISLIMEYIIEQKIKSNFNSDIYRLSIETNGTNMGKIYALLENYVNEISKIQDVRPLYYFTWSPKFYDQKIIDFSSKLLDNYFDSDIMKRLFIKLVLDDDNEEVLRKFIEKILKNHDSNIITRISVMPAGSTVEEQLKNMKRTIDFCLVYGVNISPRVHILSNFP